MTDTFMITYGAMRDQCQRELDGMQERRQALQATIAGLDRLIKDGSQIDLGGQLETPAVTTNGSKAKAAFVPPGFFKGKKVTQAYREFAELWGSGFPVPQIRDALIAGGIELNDPGKLLAALHSVLRRERLKAEREGYLTSTFSVEFKE